jgi:hypothetical protein
MQVKFLLRGAAVTIPKINLARGVNCLGVWIDGNGFTSASNDLGATGFVLLETPVVDLGEVDAEKQAVFANLHGRVVDFGVTTNTFAKDGGLASITMTVSKQQGGALVPVQLQFQADNCRGISLLSNALSFSCEMLQMEQRVALGDGPLVGDETVAAVVDDAPQSAAA